MFQDKWLPTHNDSRLKHLVAQKHFSQVTISDKKLSADTPSGENCSPSLMTDFIKLQLLT